MLCSDRAFPTRLQPIYPSRHCAQVLQVFNQSILPDIVLSSYKSSTNLPFQTLCSVPTSLQPIYPSRHCAQFLQVFNQSILPDIVLSSYKSSTNLSFQTLCSVPTSLQPIYPSSHCCQTRYYLQVFNYFILPMRTKPKVQPTNWLGVIIELSGSLPSKEIMYLPSGQWPRIKKKCKHNKGQMCTMTQDWKII